MRRHEIEIGSTFGNWTVLADAGNAENGRSLWTCECSCGTIRNITGYALKGGRTNSCGHNGAATTHGLSGHKLYRTWHGMRTRCYTESSREYRYYGARGISLCRDWYEDFMSFYIWALSAGWEQGLSIERIDVNGNYEPDNCTWIPRNEQSLNTRKTVKVFYEGVLYPSTSALCASYGIAETLVYRKIKEQGLSLIEAIELTLKRRRVK